MKGKWLMSRRCYTVLSLVAMVCVLIVAAPSQGSVLVYEPFKGYTAGEIVGQNPNANTVGMDTSTSYEFMGSGGTTRHHGDDVRHSPDYWRRIKCSSLTGNSLCKIGTYLSLGSSYTGTLYSSYLVDLTSIPSEGEAIIRATITDFGSSGYRLNSYPDGWTTRMPAVQYYGAGPEGGSGTTELAVGTTYIMLNRFTNVGEAVSVENPGVATGWTLTSEQFASFLAGGQNDAYLDAATVGTGANQVLNKMVNTESVVTATFENGNYFQMAASNQASLGIAAAATFDEFRYGASLADVTPTTGPVGPVDVTWTGGTSTTWSTATGSGNWKKTSDNTAADYANGVAVTLQRHGHGTHRRYYRGGCLSGQRGLQQLHQELCGHRYQGHRRSHGPC